VGSYLFVSFRLCTLLLGFADLFFELLTRQPEIRPGRGVYTQKPFLAVSVFFYTFGIVTFGAMRFWYGRVEVLCR